MNKQQQQQKIQKTTESQRSKIKLPRQNGNSVTESLVTKLLMSTLKKPILNILAWTLEAFLESQIKNFVI
jgi:hypothetical protein